MVITENVGGHSPIILVGEIVTIIKGKKAVEVFEEPQQGVYPYLQIEDLRSGAKPKYAHSEKSTLANQGDVLIAWDGANAGTVSFGLNGYAGSTIAILRPNTKEVHVPFLGYYLRSKFTEIQDNCTGATIPHVNRDFLENLRLPLPPLPEQRRIAAILAKADRLRRLRRIARQVGEKYLQAVFMEMFYKSSDKNWVHCKIAELTPKGTNKIRTGPFGSQLLHSEFQEQGDVLVLGIDNAVQNYFMWGKPRYITHEKYKELNRYKVFPGDVIITIMATTGRCAIVPDTIPLAINTKHLCCITLDQKKCLPSFLHASFLYNPLILKQMGGSERGAIMPGLNMEIIKNLDVSLPPVVKQQRFATIVQHYERLRLQQREAERQAELLFQGLLQQAFDGEL